ncbi:hypothetical protein ACFY3N_16730 [Streptomyces sp. NPDC000348]|uniref:hypothetical protein n=1 Tax=Streptomyces sp. NPDC000348 TaxID=3364538 RepID=UPI0036853E21
MTSAVTQEQPPRPPNGTPRDDEPGEAGVREEEFLHRDGSRLRAGSLLTTRTMARHLPAHVICPAGPETSGRRRMPGKLRRHMACMESGEEMRAGLAGPFRIGRYRKPAASVDAVERKAVNTGARPGPAGAAAGIRVGAGSCRTAARRPGPASGARRGARDRLRNRPR